MLCPFEKINIYKQNVYMVETLDKDYDCAPLFMLCSTVFSRCVIDAGHQAVPHYAEKGVRRQPHIRSPCHGCEGAEGLQYIW